MKLKDLPKIHKILTIVMTLVFLGVSAFMILGIIEEEYQNNPDNRCKAKYGQEWSGRYKTPNQPEHCINKDNEVKYP